MKYRFFVFAAMFFANTAFCQSWNTDSTENVNTVDGIIHALYNVISGPAGQERNWNDFKNLFAENARMYIAVPNDDSGSVLKSITPEEYVQRNQTRLSDIGFNEDELYRITNTYGAGTQVFSTYESNFTNKNGEEEITKGINNIQLYFDGQRYFIVTIFWDANAKNIQVPERYLPKDGNTNYHINL
ncbi:MAG: hypothetical protein ABJB05_11260 [Parafilimonas sp.]